jgi:hypothetical protein
MIDSMTASIRLGNTSSNPHSRSSPRSTGVFCRSAQFWAKAASASSPKVVLTVISRISTHEPPFGIASRRPTPCGSSTNTNGTRNAGKVYFQDCSVVL